MDRCLSCCKIRRWICGEKLRCVYRHLLAAFIDIGCQHRTLDGFLSLRLDQLIPRQRELSIGKGSVRTGAEQVVHQQMYRRGESFSASDVCLRDRTNLWGGGQV